MKNNGELRYQKLKLDIKEGKKTKSYLIFDFNMCCECGYLNVAQREELVILLDNMNE